MELFQYFTDLVDEPPPRPRHDLLSALIAAEEAGDRLTHAELLTTATLLFVAGFETTMNLVGNGILALLRNPGQLARLRDDPALAATAVEELLRYDGPVHVTARIATAGRGDRRRDHPPGEQVVVVAGGGQPRPRRSSPTPTGSTSAARPTATSLRRPGPTSAWARPWPAWRARSPSAPSCAGSPTSSWPPSEPDVPRPLRHPGPRRSCGCASRHVVGSPRSRVACDSTWASDKPLVHLLIPEWGGPGIHQTFGHRIPPMALLVLAAHARRAGWEPRSSTRTSRSCPTRRPDLAVPHASGRDRAPGLPHGRRLPGQGRARACSAASTPR